jgi:DNA-binding transcriptional regulator YiaG
LEATYKRKARCNMDKETIKQIRKSYNLNQRNFAERVNCSFSVIALVEVGKRRVTQDLENKVKKAFGLNEEKIKELIASI